MKIYKAPKKKDDVEIIKNMRYDYDGVFDDFYQAFKDKEHINFDFFFNRLNKLKIKAVNSDRDFVNKHAFAEYGIINNVMKVKPGMFKSSIMHEIFHLASSCLVNNIAYTGFQQYNLKTDEVIGMGLNEAYTNLLDRRYFGDYTETKREDLRYTYMVTTSLISILENFVGEEEMESWYFKADLKSLIDYLENYMSKDECLAFVMAMDNLFLLVDNGAIKHPKMAADSYKYIINFLGRCYMNLYIEEYYKGAYDKEELKERLKMVYELMRKRLTFSYFRIPFTKKISKDNFRAYMYYEKNKVLKKCA